MSEDELGCWSVGTVWQGYPLLSQRLRLRPLKAADVPEIARLLDDWEVVRLTANIPHPFSEDDAHSFVAMMEGKRAARIGAALAMERVLDGAVVGAIGFGLEHDGTPELGYWVGREHWGQGFASEAARRLVRHLFEDMGVARVWASAHPDNAASRRVLEHAGLAPEGHEMVAMPARGQSVVMPVVAVTREAWSERHATRPTILVAAAALIDPDGRVLLASRPPGKVMAGLWEFPGGKVDPGETPEAALVRELAEELGIDVRESCLAPLAFASHDYDIFHMLMPLYAVRQWRGVVEAREGQDLRWVLPTRMAGLPMPPADIPLVAILRDWV